MFKVPEHFRVRTGYMASDADAGNNGVFRMPSRPGQPPLQIIASDGEEYRPIKGFESYYRVSNLGNVRAVERDVSVPNGGVRNHPPHLVALEKIDTGYLRASLCVDGTIEKRLVHVLVAEAFIPNPSNFPQVNHKNGTKSCNHIFNLEWCSQEYNAHHAIETGLRSGLKTEQILTIKEMLDSGLTPAQVAEQLGRARQTISDIKFGRHRNLNPDAPVGASAEDWPMLWEHVSVSRPDRTPTWDEMCAVKAAFWSDDECVMQLHPPKADWVNNHQRCLHLWRPMATEIPRPPSMMVGYAELGVLA